MNITKAKYDEMVILLDDQLNPSLNGVRISQLSQSALEVILNGPFSKSDDPALRSFAAACKMRWEINQRQHLSPEAVAANLFQASLVDHVDQVATNLLERKQLQKRVTELYAYNRAKAHEIGVFRDHTHQLVFKIKDGNITVDVYSETVVVYGVSVKEVLSDHYLSTVEESAGAQPVPPNQKESS